jgi:hypothetical protein
MKHCDVCNEIHEQQSLYIPSQKWKKEAKDTYLKITICLLE